MCLEPTYCQRERERERERERASEREIEGGGGVFALQHSAREAKKEGRRGEEEDKTRSDRREKAR